MSHVTGSIFYSNLVVVFQLFDIVWNLAPHPKIGVDGGKLNRKTELSDYHQVFFAKPNTALFFKALVLLKYNLQLGFW